jgi:hypothetical protein
MPSGYYFTVIDLLIIVLILATLDIVPSTHKPGLKLLLLFASLLLLAFLLLQGSL